MPRCRICNRHIEETSEETRTTTGIMWKDTKGGAHCLTSDNEYLTMEDSPMHDSVPGELRDRLESLTVRVGVVTLLLLVVVVVATGIAVLQGWVGS